MWFNNYYLFPNFKLFFVVLGSWDWFNRTVQLTFSKRKHIFSVWMHYFVAAKQTYIAKFLGFSLKFKKWRAVSGSKELNLLLKSLPVEIILILEVTASQRVMYFNPQPTNNIDIRFSTTVCFLQILSHFLLFWKGRTKFTHPSGNWILSKMKHTFGN